MSLNEYIDDWRALTLKMASVGGSCDCISCTKRRDDISAAELLLLSNLSAEPADDIDGIIVKLSIWIEAMLENEFANLPQRTPQDALLVSMRRDFNTLKLEAGKAQPQLMRAHR